MLTLRKGELYKKAIISDSLLVSSGLDFLFVAVQGWPRASPVRCGPGRGPGVREEGRVSGQANLNYVIILIMYYY